MVYSQAFRCCLFAVAFIPVGLPLAYASEVVDGRGGPPTQRNGMHACPPGMGITGLHAANNWLSCAPILGGISSEQLDGPPPTQRENMHACPPGRVLTGVHLGNNQFICGNKVVGHINQSLLPENNPIPSNWRLLETTRDWCRNGDVVLVFNRYFQIRGSNQEPIGDTGPFVVVTKGAPTVVINLTQRRFRWHCGARMNSWAGSVSDVASQTTLDQCNQALRSDDETIQGIYVTLCQALAPVIGEIVRGIAGNWEATRCASNTKQVKLNYARNGRLTWQCYGPR